MPDKDRDRNAQMRDRADQKAPTRVRIPDTAQARRAGRPRRQGVASTEKLGRKKLCPCGGCGVADRRYGGHDLASGSAPAALAVGRRPLRWTAVGGWA
jgi:hypothetical protein